jgi:hypothetical protein
MFEENNQKKKEKEHKDSSDEMIDSFFGSHNIDKKKGDQNHNFEETEQLIDKIIGEDSTPSDNRNSIDNESNFSEKENLPSNEQEFSEDNDSFEEKNQNANRHPKEEIFEIDKPTKQNLTENNHSSTPNDLLEKKEGNTFFKGKRDESKGKDKDGKIKFSLNIPKFNIKFGKRETKKDKNPIEKTKNNNQKQLDYSENNIPNKMEKSSQSTGRIHGLNKLQKQQDQSEQKEKDETKQKQSVTQPQKEKRSLFKSKDKSFHFFKSKPENKSKESVEKQLDTDQTNEDTVVDEEVIELLKITDDLLGKLPDEVIEEFSQSEDFSLYEKVMKKYEIVK